MESYIKGVLCLFLVHLVLGDPTSPCPEVLSYESRKQQDRLYGKISVATDDDLEGVWVKIFLDRRAHFLGNWFSQAESKDYKMFNIKNPEYKLAVGPPIQIRFFIEHDPDDVPNIIKISLNGKVICPTSKPHPAPDIPLFISAEKSSLNSDQSHRGNGNKHKVDASRRNSSQPIYEESEDNYHEHHHHQQEHSRPLKGTLLSTTPTNTSNEEEEFFWGDLANIKNKRTTSRPITTTKKPIQCGTEAHQRAAPLINNGYETVPGQWPWHAALYISSQTELKYSCGGTLVSDQHVVTAAHCVTKLRTTETVPKERLVVYLGKYNIIKFSSEIQDRLIESIKVHPDYNATVLFNDIAVLKLKSPVEINNYVRSCCLWEGDSNFNDILGKKGTVVGWGFDEHGQITKNLMQAEMPIVSTDTCLFSNRDFFSTFLYDKNFCAGFRNGTTVCNGDSGGGLVLPRRNTNGDSTVWQLRGVVSVGVAQASTSGTVCNPKHYSIFTDAAKFVPWLKRVMS